MTSLGSTEGDYRIAQLSNDIRQSLLNMFVVCLSVLALARVDAILFTNRPDLFMKMVAYRIGYVLATILFGLVLHRVTKVRIYDRLIFGWIFFTVIFLVLFNFTRPVDYLTASFDVIVPFAIYMLSPLRIHHTFALAMGFSIGTIYADYFFKFGVDPITLNVTTSAQIVVHVVGMLSALQIQTYRRKFFQAYIDEKDAKEMVAYLANIDLLTKSLTRRHFFSYAESEFKRFKRYQRPMSVMIIDADHFKKINDTYGHHAGDLALRSLSLVAMDHKRAQDIFGRLGGEEFGLLLPETNLQQAFIVGERIQQMWAQSPVNLDGELIHSTVSIGVAEVSFNDESFDDLLQRADKMLYKAKETGRNKVVAE
ncbi:MAG TPA: GGDEF domain-containing protein [Anaerolineales bacterium]|nr:GGDEF domain-containing protein [Anaerolineales bacterium]